MKEPLPKIDSSKEAAKIEKFIRKMVAESSASGVVVGLSGGIDSAVVGSLCARALGKDRLFGVLMPSDHTPKEDIDDARAMAGEWGIRSARVDISPLARAVASSLAETENRVAFANVQARLRMTILYFVANSRNLLVAGTGDRSEEQVGFFSKYGDGGTDFLPIAHLYKTQVRALGQFLGLPARVVKKPASPQLWPGHTAAQELPADYDVLDVVLYQMLDRHRSPAMAASRAGVPLQVAVRAMEMHRSTAHKRALPPSLA